MQLTFLIYYVNLIYRLRKVSTLQTRKRKIKMASNLFVITADDVTKAHTISFKFIFNSGIKIEENDRLQRLWSKYGYVFQRPYGGDEIRLSELGPEETERPSPDERSKLRRWQFDIGQKGRNIFSGSTETTPKMKCEDGLVDLLRDEKFPDCVLLMKRNVFDRFQEACQQVPGLQLDHFHFDGVLSTN